MRRYCEECKIPVKWTFIGSYEDERGRTWEVYECPYCKTRIEYAVS